MAKVKTESKKEAMKAMAAMLVEMGLSLDGQTRQESFKIITSSSYPLPGALVTTGGRDRFAHPSGVFVTVGPNKSCVYRKNRMTVSLPATPWREAAEVERWGEPYDFHRFPTTDRDGVRGQLLAMGLAGAAEPPEK